MFLKNFLKFACIFVCGGGVFSGTYVVQKNYEKLMPSKGTYFLVKITQKGNDPTASEQIPSPVAVEDVAKSSDQAEEVVSGIQHKFYTTEADGTKTKNFRCQKASKDLIHYSFDPWCEIYKITEKTGSSKNYEKDDINAQITLIKDDSELKDGDYYILKIEDYIYRTLNNQDSLELVDFNTSLNSRHTFAKIDIKMDLLGKQTQFKYPDKFKSQFIVAKAIASLESGIDIKNVDKFKCENPNDDSEVTGCAIYKFEGMDTTKTYKTADYEKMKKIKEKNDFTLNHLYLIDLQTKNIMVENQNKFILKNQSLDKITEFSVETGILIDIDDNKKKAETKIFFLKN